MSILRATFLVAGVTVLVTSVTFLVTFLVTPNTTRLNLNKLARVEV